MVTFLYVAVPVPQIECKKLGFKNLEELEIEIDAISDKIR